jgi:hypothetical protein
MQNEKWKKILGYEGLYEVSDQGRVKSLERKVWFNHSKTNERFLKKHKARIFKPQLCRGYHIVGLSKNGETRSFRVNRLVAVAFCENPLNKRCVNHINGIKTDNRAENLEWCTHTENNLHARETGLAYFPSGENCKNRVEVKCTKTNQVFISIKEAAKFNNLNPTTLSRKLRGVYTNNTSLEIFR